jgi:hypothetical protein
MTTRVLWVLLSIGVTAVVVPRSAHAQYDDWEAAEDEMQQEAPPPAAVEPADAGPGSARPAEADGGAEDEARAEVTEDQEVAEDDDSETDDAGVRVLRSVGISEDLIGAPASRLVGWIEISTYFGRYENTFLSTDGVATSPLLGVAYQISERVRVGGAWGFVLFPHSAIRSTGTPQDGGLAFRSGNALLHGDWLTDVEDLRYRIGVGVTLPFATTSSLADTAALELAMGMRGAWDIWMWAPNRLSVIATGRLELDLAPQLIVGGDAGAAILFSTADSSDETLITAQLAGFAEYVADPFVVGLQVFAVLAGDALPDRKDVELALQPYVRLSFERTFLLAGFVMNLLPPFGVSFQEGNPWGIRLGFGTVL